MATLVLLLVHLVWATTVAYVATLCSRWLGSRVDSGTRDAELRKTVDWIQAELTKLKAIPSKAPRF